jgi:O-acetylhomoserine (thiol)-lyase
MQNETIALHHGYDKDTQGTMAVPIYMSTAYEFKDSKHAADLFALKELGNIYTRLSNPTSGVFEKRFAELEGGVSAVATSSGMAAIFSTIVNLCEAGDNIIVANAVYGGTSTLTDHTIKRFGITTRKFDVTDPKKLEKLIDKKTKLILFESLSNPNLQVANFKKIVKIANKHNIITVVDNTVATPYICNPIKLGCDIVVHSTSKYTTGQGLALGGIIVDSQNCIDKIKNNKRYDHFNTPDESYHGLVYTQLPYPPFTMRLILSVLRDLGATPSPFNSWLMIQGLETLGLRMKQHSKSALKIAKFLQKHKKVNKVNYAGLKSDPNHKRAKKYLSGGYSGLLSFEVDSLETAKDIVDNIKIFSCVVNIGDSKSIITHPVSTTHQQLSIEELENAGIGQGLIRLSIGLEDTDDLIAELKKVLG